MVYRIHPRNRPLEDVLEEYIMLGWHAEIDGDEIVLYDEHEKKKRQPRGPQPKWSKRERNFGWTRER